MKCMSRLNTVIQWHNHVIWTYCDMLKILLAYETPASYTDGARGWNADIYEFGDVAIRIRHRPFGTVQVTPETAAKHSPQACGTAPELRRKLTEQFVRKMIEMAEANQ